MKLRTKRDKKVFDHGFELGKGQGWIKGRDFGVQVEKDRLAADRKRLEDRLTQTDEKVLNSLSQLTEAVARAYLGYKRVL